MVTRPSMTRNTSSWSSWLCQFVEPIPLATLNRLPLPLASTRWDQNSVSRAASRARFTFSMTSMLPGAGRRRQCWKCRMPQDSYRDPPSVVLIVDEGSNPFELACVCEVFGARRRPEIGRELYRFRVVTPRRRVAVRDAMFTIGDAGDLGDIDDAHTVFVPNRPDTDTPTHPAVIKAL
jgi:hypothetical protein